MSVKVPNLGRYASIEKEVVSKDGTRKFLLKLLDGNFIECVLLLQDYGNTVCISSQVGCKMGCAFCATGQGGFVRNLSMEEMLVQVLIARKAGEKSALCGMSTRDATSQPYANAPLTRVVVMGMGEPFDNFDNVVAFLKAVDIGARKISVSTCGIPDKIRAFADLGMQVNLCISLHAPNDIVRQKIMPIAKVHKIADVMSAAKYFFDKTKRRVIFEYSLIEGVNCEIVHAQELVHLVKKTRISAHVNLINLNEGGSDTLKSPSRNKAMVFMDALIKGGVSVTMRKGKGQDIMAACGQLKTRFDKKIDEVGEV